MIKFEFNVNTSAMTQKEVDYLRDCLVKYSSLDKSDILAMQPSEITLYFFNELAYIDVQANGVIKIKSYNHIKERFGIDNFELDYEFPVTLNGKDPDSEAIIVC